jgi:small-conductance mechanosensitive channel
MRKAWTAALTWVKKITSQGWHIVKRSRGSAAVAALAAILIVGAVVGVATSLAASSRPPQPYAEVEAVADPAHSGAPGSDVERISRSFAIFIDQVGAGLSQLLGPWSQRDLFWQVTPAKLILGLLSALVILLLLRIVRFILEKQHLPHLDENRRYWVGGLLRAFRKAIGIFAWVTACFLFVSALLPHLAIALHSQVPFQLVSRLAEIGYFFSAVVFAFYVVRLVDDWLNQLAQRQPRRWFYPTFPLIGKLLYYNFLVTAFQYLIYLLHLPGPAQAVASKAVSIVTIVVNAVMVIQMVRALEDIAVVHSERTHDVYRFRSVQTRWRVLRQLIVFIIAIFCAATILMNFDAVRQVGAGLLASAGVAGVIVGFAAQKSLSTIIAGLQVALTDPVRIGDFVIVEGESGEIEEISLTYVVLRTWDQRRLILPITYFLDKSFQNWTRSSSQLLGTVFLYVDYTVPIDEIRAEGQRIVSESSWWDKRAFGVQVTDWKTNSVEIRVLVSAETASQLWDLRCEVREKLLAFLQHRDPDAFPQVRNVVTRTSRRSDGQQAVGEK